MKFKYLYLSFLIALVIVLTSKPASAQSNMPGWYMNPPADDENYFYAIAEGEVLRDAALNALINMAQKIEMKYEAINESFIEESEDPNAVYDSTFSEVSKTTVNHNFGNINVSAVQTLEEIQASDGYVSVFTNASKMIFSNENGEFEAEFYEEENTKNKPVYTTSSSAMHSGIGFEDVLSYIENDPGMDLVIESRWTESGYQYYVMFKYTIAEARNTLEEALDKDAELYRKFKESKAFEELQKDLESKKDTTGN